MKSSIKKMSGFTTSSGNTLSLPFGKTPFSISSKKIAPISKTSNKTSSSIPKSSRNSSPFAPSSSKVSSNKPESLKKLSKSASSEA
jgi:hypothetical protein